MNIKGVVGGEAAGNGVGYDWAVGGRGGVVAGVGSRGVRRIEEAAWRAGSSLPVAENRQKPVPSSRRRANQGRVASERVSGKEGQVSRR